MGALLALGTHTHAVWEDFGPIEWAVAVLAALFVVWSIWRAVHYTMHPGEEDPDHYKQIIFGEPTPEQAVSSSEPSDPTAS